jgi:hypothetical protein
LTAQARFVTDPSPIAVFGAPGEQHHTSPPGAGMGCNCLPRKTNWGAAPHPDRVVSREGIAGGGDACQPNPTQTKCFHGFRPPSLGPSWAGKAQVLGHRPYPILALLGSPTEPGPLRAPENTLSLILCGDRAGRRHAGAAERRGLAQGVRGRRLPVAVTANHYAGALIKRLVAGRPGARTSISTSAASGHRGR